MRNQSHFRDFVELVREWIHLYPSASIAGLPATDRRAQLEKIMWQALQEIVEYSKSEEAAKNAEERLQVLELLNHAVKAELPAWFRAIWGQFHFGSSNLELFFDTLYALYELV